MGYMREKPGVAYLCLFINLISNLRTFCVIKRGVLFLYVTQTPVELYIFFLSYYRGTKVIAVGRTHISCNSLLWQLLLIFVFNVIHCVSESFT